MTTLHELRDMLDKAEGPSRRLDQAIQFTLCDDHASYIREFTASIDAALELVGRKLPGWRWDVGNPFWRDGIFVCRLARPGASDWSSSLVESADAPTAPLAILKALIAAKIEEGENG